MDRNSTRTTQQSSNGRGNAKEEAIVRGLRTCFETLSTFGRTMTPNLINVWIAALADLSIEEIEFGFLRVMRTSESVPAPATIRKLVEEYNADTLEEQADEALRRLDRLIGEWGADCIPEWRDGGLQRAPKLDAATKRALDSIGGWRVYAMAGEEARFLRKDFLEAYKRFARRKAQENRFAGGAHGELGVAPHSIAESKTVQ